MHDRCEIGSTSCNGKGAETSNTKIVRQKYARETSNFDKKCIMRLYATVYLHA